MNELADMLSDTRKIHKLESLQYRRVLQRALKELYELVEKLVIDNVTLKS